MVNANKSITRHLKEEYTTTSEFASLIISELDNKTISDCIDYLCDYQSLQLKKYLEREKEIKVYDYHPEFNHASVVAQLIALMYAIQKLHGNCTINIYLKNIDTINTFTGLNRITIRCNDNTVQDYIFT